jgi:hypothetical protein
MSLRTIFGLSLAALLATAPAHALNEIRENPQIRQVQLTNLEKAAYAGARLRNNATTYEEYLGGSSVYTFFTILHREQEGTIGYAEASRMVRDLGAIHTNKETIEAHLDGKGNRDIPELHDVEKGLSNLCWGYLFIRVVSGKNEDAFETDIASSELLQRFASDSSYCGN